MFVDNDYINSTQAESDRKYWHNALHELSVNNFYRCKGISTNSDTSVDSINIKGVLYQKIQKAVQNHGISHTDIFLTALELLASKYTNSALISIGLLVPVQNENKPYNSIEIFTNTIVFNNRIHSHENIGDLIKNTRLRLQDVLKHSQYPFSKLMKELDIDLINSTPLAASIAVYEKKENTVAINKNIYGLESISENFPASFLGLHFEVHEAEDEWLIYIKFNALQFKDWQINDVLATYQYILEQITSEENFSLPLYRVEMLHLSEQLTLINDWSGSDEAHMPCERLEHAFEMVRKLKNDRSVVEFNKQCFSYAEIDQWSDTIAEVLSDISDNNMVAICMEKGIGLIVTIIAALKANLTYLPIDPKYPATRIQYMLDDTQCKNIVTNVSIDGLSLGDINIIQFNNLKRYTHNEHTPIPKSTNNPIACIIYTSGSTGQPKPVMVTHSSIINLIYNQLKYFKIDSNDKILQFSSISFDASISETWISLLSGATLVVPQDKYLSGELLTKTILENNISVLIIPPTILDTISDSSKVCTTLKTLVSAGESLATSTVKKWAGNVTNFINAYGPSETTVCATYCFYNKNLSNDNIIGKPIDGARVYILNSDLSLSPIGCIGELYIGGAGVSPGYYNHSELDEGRFIISPFISNAKLYKTGDLAKWLNDGNIQYVGRIDRQVKFNGIRVELEEIESHLSSHPSVNLCAVAIESSPKNHEKKLVAYLTTNPSNEAVFSDSILKQSIREYLLSKLPLSIVPNKYVVLDDFPRLPNGKIDRAKLRDIVTTVCSHKNTIDNFTTTIERELAEIYGEILTIKVNQISPESNFFDLGGTSLIAITAVARINTKYKISLSIDEFFTVSNLKDLANKIQTNLDSSNNVNPLIDLSNLYTSCLDLDDNQDIGCDLSFFDLGGTSLSAIKLLSEIKKKYSVELSIDRFFSDSSINAVLQLIDGENINQGEEDAILHLDQLEDDLFYDVGSIVSDTGNLVEKVPCKIKDILLTGATGFLGIYLLNSLLNSTDNTIIHCLIRVDEKDELLSKLASTSKKYNITTIDFNRVRLYTSDISKIDLGLSNNDYDYLAKNIDSIYHCAAAVNHIYHYGMLRKTNVLGTIEIIKLATTFKKKIIHYISALDIAILKQEQNSFLDEKNSIMNKMGYIQTKWVSEYLLDKATSLLNLPVRIYRPGNIIGDLKHGLMDPATNHFLMFIKGCIQLGYGPDTDFSIEMTPVDVISESIVKISMLRDDKSLSIYNLHNPNSISWRKYAEMVNITGYKFSLIDASHWAQHHLANIDTTNALFALKSYYMNDEIRLNTGLEKVPYTEVQMILDEHAIYYPDDYQILNEAYFKQLQNVEFLSQLKQSI